MVAPGCCLLPALAAAQPVPNRIYALQGATARMNAARPAGPGRCATRPAAPSPRRRIRRRAAPVARRLVSAVTGPACPSAVASPPGMSMLVTGQSQAAGLFDATWPRVGAHPAGPGDPPAPAVSAVLQSCLGRPGCPAGGHALGHAGRGARRPHPAGRAGAAAARHPLRPGGCRLGRRRRSPTCSTPPGRRAGTWSGWRRRRRRPPPCWSWRMAPRMRCAARRRRTTSPGSARWSRCCGRPAATRPCRRCRRRSRRCGTRSGCSGPAGWRIGPGWRAGEGWPFRLGLARRRPLDPGTAAHATVIRAAQAEAARRFGLLPGGDMAGVETGADGIHWSAEGFATPRGKRRRRSSGRWRMARGVRDPEGRAAR